MPTCLLWKMGIIVWKYFHTRTLVFIRGHNINAVVIKQFCNYLGNSDGKLIYK